MDKRQTWDQALRHRLHSENRRQRVGGVLAALLAVGLVVGLLPGVAQAHFDVEGPNGAQLDISDEEISFAFIPRPIPVNGRSFVANDRVLIFQCPVGAVDLQNKCQTIGAATTDASGAFSTQAVVNNTIVSPSGVKTVCKGYSGSTTQCSVAAATYDTSLGEPTSMADHYLCFQDALVSCTINRDGSPTTTTTTNPPLGPEWEPAAPMGTARQGLATAVGDDGRIYALGGDDADSNALSSAEVFDPCGQKTWSPIAPMPTARTDFAAATGPDGRIYAIGGTDRRHGTPLATVDAYDPATNTWTTGLARLAVPRSHLAAAPGPDGRVYAIGGRFANARDSSIVEAYDPASNEWQLVAPLLSSRYLHGAVRITDGRIYAVGGMGLNGDPRPAVESYGPGPSGTPGTWAPSMSAMMVTPSLPPDMAVSTGPDGRIYGTGGTISAGTVAVRSWRVYDIAADTWTTSPEAMTSLRTNHAGATGLDGRIYAIGGTDDPFFAVGAPFPMSSVESVKVGPNSCPSVVPPADFDADGDTDISVFRPSAGTWFVKDGATLGWGAPGDVAVPADYDGNRSTDVAVFRPSNGVWYVKDGQSLAWGVEGDIPVPADYDGDEKADIAVFRPSTGVWYLRYSGGGDAAVGWGANGDVAVPADYDGDGKADLAVFRSGMWYLHPASGAADVAVNYGITGDIPVVADYDADRTADIAVFRPSSGAWYLRHSSDGAEEAFGFGATGDVPAPGDYNGDRVADPAVFRPSNGVWYIETGDTAPWGAAGDVALPLPAAVHMAS